VRACVIGCSGAGKTTFGKRLAARLGCPFVELDSICHQPNWTPLAEDAFRARVEAALSSDQWVCDGNYRHLLDLVNKHATLVPNARVAVKENAKGEVVFAIIVPTPMAGVRD
jgi:adenylate kinase family enzyme